MNIEISKSNICSLEDESETSKQAGDTVLQVLKTPIARIVLFISKIHIKTNQCNNLRKTFSIEQDLKISKFALVHPIKCQSVPQILRETQVFLIPSQKQ